ncbi:hypothetical protein GGS23DRAFT_606296 [Durotheca rogersii]|uniref:uncharacterized protein n=1 Tax=Durotheca rogersii TaxID=419775 RepID=UPI002220C95C|nr:uncharacterized protein GGS23DRAFT_606296 [Durotheca rogersii]KAI5861425.1 hypothetical protein GGS23DRAFT_606296 [Durotheca rogersii]
MEGNKPTLHFMTNSGSQQSLWLLEELGIEYNLVLHERDRGRAAVALRDTHPLGKAPQLVTASGRTIAERSAIAYYLIETYDKEGRFKRPADDRENDQFREQQLLSVGMTSANVYMSLKVVLSALAHSTPFFVRPLILSILWVLSRAFLDAEIDSVFKFLDAELEGRQFFNGTERPTGLDFVLQWYVDFGRWGCGIDLDKYPKIREWNDRCVSREAWKKALKKGNGYGVAFWEK